MVQRCSCAECASDELTLDDGRRIPVSGLRRTFLEFQALGMPPGAMVTEMLAARIRPDRPLPEADRAPFAAALAREYARYCGGPQASPAETGTTTSVEVFTKPGCPYTRGLKRKLEHEGTAFIEHDVLGNPAMLQRMLELNGGRRNVPTVRQGDQVTVGFHGT